ESTSMENAKQLTSPLLHDIDGNNDPKRARWQQICSYS
ncbi:DNA polymerase III subunit psi, partial [Vibrio parahaemolyticus]|nr:DNA polymerase III subunit psi [Vibrio parahaemolyticus]